ncbi:MAG TPA: M1 family aminopeptidase, partial [Bacteroidia bacterium]|nr:M1 family aminopeptidase [Bacteroidia bacterium]
RVQVTEKISEFGNDNTIPESAQAFKTIIFKQDSIHDCAWFADKRFHVLKGTVTIESGHKSVDTWAYFTNLEPHLWKNSIQYINDALKFYSSNVGNYPYAQYSAVDGTVTAGGGMEYPMITVINKSENNFTLNNVLGHEIGHSWFYGILGSNERKHGWMDEGINSYYEMQYIKDQYQGENGKGKNDLAINGFFGNITGVNSLNMKQGFELGYKASAYNNNDQPATTSPVEFTLLNYGTVMYAKTALAFDFLRGYLGDPLYKSCMQSYYEKWKFKHPQPEDIKQEFESVSGKNLDWFFNGILGTNYPVEYKIKSATYTSNSYNLKLQNSGNLEAPFYLAGDDSVKTWFDGFKGEKEITVAMPSSKTIFVNDEYAAVLKTNSSQFRTKAVCKNCSKLNLKMFPNATETGGLQYLYLMPLAAWNRYNGWMAGVNFSNIDFIPQPFEFSLTPFYDFKNNQISGMANINYHVWPLEGLFSGITFSVKGKRFAYANNETEGEIDPPSVFTYSKIEPGVEFSFRKKVPRSKLQHTISLRSVNLWQDEIEYTFKDSAYQKQYVTRFVNINEISYLLTNKRTIDPFSSLVKLEQGQKHLKLSAEFNYKLSYSKRNKSLDVRLFAGGFLTNNNDVRNYNFRMSGWEGSRDYLYDEIYLGRTDDHGFWDNQFMIRDGGFKIPTFVGQSNKWIASMNITADLPFPLPVRFFVDLGTYEGISTVFPEFSNRVMFDGGISVYIIKDVIEVYVPLFNSDDIEKNLEVNDYKFFDTVRFVFNINKMSPLHLRNQVYQLFE